MTIVASVIITVYCAIKSFQHWLDIHDNRVRDEAYGELLELLMKEENNGSEPLG